MKVVPAAGDSISWVTGQWIVPNVSRPNREEDFYSCHWIGIDGDGSTPLFQAGTECDISKGGRRKFYAWYEWLPDNPYQVKIKSVKVTPGDYVNVIICSDSGAGSTTGTVYFANITAGVYTSFSLSAPNSALLGQSAEWVSEVTMVNKVIDISKLPDFGEVYFGAAIAGTVNSSDLDGHDGTVIEMQASPTSPVVGLGSAVGPNVVKTEYLGPPGSS